MKRIVLIGLAALFAVAAVLVAWVGLKSGGGKKPQPSAPLAYGVVVAARDLPPGQVLGSADLRLEKLSSLPVNTFAAQGALIGRQLAAPASAGQPLTRDLLLEAHPLASHLLPGERAVALQTSKIVGVGGYLRPGDWVDLLVHVRGQAETSGKSSALLALSRLRVLSYENQLPEPAVAAPGQEGDKDGAATDSVATAPARAEPRSEKNPTVVLAVPAEQVARLLLASESGVVRLALRPPESVDPGLASTPAYQPPPISAQEAQQVNLSQLSFSKSLATPGAKPTGAPRLRIEQRVEIFDGDRPRGAGQK